MANIEELLAQEKKRIDDLAVPNEIENRLRTTLENIPEKKKNNFKLKAASVILVFFLLGCNLDTLAYYGKVLMGFENAMNGTLQELNEMGKGQIIDKSHTFQNGVKITLNGIMLDDNNMIVFYTINAPDGNVMDVSSDLRVSMTGFGGRFFALGGQGQASEDLSEIKWVVSTRQTPRFYEKTFKFKAEMTHNSRENATITFKIDRNKAVGKSLKIPIQKNIDLDQRSIKLQSLTASPTTTVLQGQIQDEIGLGFDYVNQNRFRPEKLEISLIADGQEIARQGTEMSTDMKGINFHLTYDALPKDTKELQLMLTSFGGDNDTDKLIKLEKDKTKKFEVLGQEIIIENIYESEGNTYITFTTEENVILSRVYLNIDGEKKELRETIPGESKKIITDDKANAIIYYTRTMKFEGTGEELKLDIERIRYTKDYDMVIWNVCRNQ